VACPSKSFANEDDSCLLKTESSANIDSLKILGIVLSMRDRRRVSSFSRVLTLLLCSFFCYNDISSFEEYPVKENKELFKHVSRSQGSRIFYRVARIHRVIAGAEEH